MNSNTTQNGTENKDSHIETSHKIALITIYTVVLMVGTTGLIFMIRILKTNLRSWTTIAFLNLLLAHFIFLLTIPFRIYYYATNHWGLSRSFCKIVSAMIHLHMYVVFVIYVVILIIRFLQYFKKIDRMEFYRRLHALGASIGIWSIVIILGPILLIHYGKTRNDEQTKCFNFGDEANKSWVFGLNIFLSVLIILVSCALSCVLGIILRNLIKKHGAASRVQQEVWAQVKSISLIIIIFTCLVPYHIFRLFYLKNLKTLEHVNEVFLAITTLTCCDMLLIFAGKGICHVCGF
ncbi:probable G-protein coupled receptor 141 [Hoplias malabaricus]|uniref:probable G-protein coupled receptor 141 n=1 Tax=Hoplias malabaricus TaxID=27720 RepID=UPI003462BF27